MSETTHHGNPKNVKHPLMEEYEIITEKLPRTLKQLEVKYNPENKCLNKCPEMIPSYISRRRKMVDI